MVVAVLDYMTQPADPATLKALNVGVMPYIAPKAWGWTKAVTAGQLRDLERAGVPYALNFETNAQQMEGGYARGVLDGQAINLARTELLVNDGRPQYVSCDEGVDPSRFGLMEAYIRGLRQVLGADIKLGVYGEGALIEYLVGCGLITYGWESESTSFPGNASPTAHTVLRQCYGKSIAGLGGSYDCNDVYAADWGQWPAPPPDPPKPKKGHKLTYLFTCKNRPGAPVGALYITDGVTFRWVGSPKDRDSQIWQGAMQGIDITSGNKIPDLDWASTVAHMVEVAPAGGNAPGA